MDGCRAERTVKAVASGFFILLFGGKPVSVVVFHAGMISWREAPVKGILKNIGKNKAFYSKIVSLCVNILLTIVKLSW